jgi:hypothetical protein
VGEEEQEGVEVGEEEQEGVEVGEKGGVEKWRRRRVCRGVKVGGCVEV